MIENKMKRYVLTILTACGNLIYVFLILITCVKEHKAYYEKGVEDDLIATLLRRYNSRGRPATRDYPTVVIKHELSLIRLVDLKDNILTIDTWQDLEWHDHRLVWNPHRFNGTSIVNLPVEDLWIPDIILYNNAGLGSGLKAENLRAIVAYDGSVFLAPPTRLSAYCGDTLGLATDDDRFVVCHLKFGSWTYDGLRVDIRNRSSFLDLGSYYTNEVWEIFNTTVSRNVRRYACCPEPFPDVTYTLVMKRRYKKQKKRKYC